MNIYTRRGDDGSTGLYRGGRVRKDDPLIELVGSIDEAQAALGLARAETGGADLDALLSRIERDLWIVMAEVASPGVTGAQNSVVEQAMIDQLEHDIDAALAGLDLSSNFAVPGENRLSALLDVARTVVRRAERNYVRASLSDTLVGTYLNRLSDLCWALARSTEAEHAVNRREPR